jgi:hypothetical protein
MNAADNPADANGRYRTRRRRRTRAPEAGAEGADYAAEPIDTPVVE